MDRVMARARRLLPAMIRAPVRVGRPSRRGQSAPAPMLHGRRRTVECARRCGGGIVVVMVGGGGRAVRREQAHGGEIGEGGGAAEEDGDGLAGVKVACGVRAAFRGGVCAAR
jgi:sugar phosphate isomerase/epimerase